ncbi:MAG: glycosyltransferase [Deltaproteobacteria bacterium]|nr:glycosyltransferase [Deltaproteobacteria bacterium]
MNSPRFTITTVARLVDEKNLFFALQVMKAIKEDQEYDFRYHIIGDGPLREAITKAIDQFNLSHHVKLFGALRHRDVRQQLAETDLFLLPSGYEASPVCVLEAQAMGIPVVATCVGGLDEAVQDGRTGYLIPLNDVQEAKFRIDFLHGNSDLRQQMGAQGRKFVEDNFDIRKITKRLVDIYEAQLAN